MRFAFLLFDFGKKKLSQAIVHAYYIFSHFCTILLSCQPRVTVTTCFVYKVIRGLESIDHLCINPILWIGLIYK